MTDRIQEIRARCDTATPGPWEVVDGKSFGVQSENKNIAMCFRPENEHFIAHAREDIPFLLAELDRLTDGIPLDRLREICEAEREWRVVVLPKPLTVDDLETIKNIGCIVRNIEAAEAAMKGADKDA